MKTFCKFTASVLLMFLMATYSVGQTDAPQAALANISEGVGTINGGSNNWAGFSELVLIPGSSFLGIKAATNVFTLVFTGGSTVDIGNMVLYKTARSGGANLGTKKLTLGLVSNPSINLTSPSVCPNQPVSTTNPCYIKLDALKGALSPLNDYYFVVFFLNDTNNQTVVGGRSPLQGALSGFFMSGDETRIKKNGAIPNGNSDAAPIFLAYVTNQ
ncbi:MAG: hypothetical protein HY010_22995 [Acidobacteria bacterium]|nr:hypothetical protein [Acidobacteriota bacterium]